MIFRSHEIILEVWAITRHQIKASIVKVMGTQIGCSSSSRWELWITSRSMEGTSSQTEALQSLEVQCITANIVWRTNSNKSSRLHKRCRWCSKSSKYTSRWITSMGRPMVKHSTISSSRWAQTWGWLTHTLTPIINLDPRPANFCPRSSSKTSNPSSTFSSYSTSN